MPSHVFGAFFMGDLMLLLTLGIVYSIELVIYSYNMFLVATILLVEFVYHVVMSWHKNKKTTFWVNVMGLVGASLVMLLFGLQSPQISYKLTLGLALVFYTLGTYYWVRDKK